MSETKFTKGDWEIKEAIAFKNQIKVKDKKGKEGRIVGNIRTREDAHLIAAAPEMYEMLEELSWIIHRMGVESASDRIDHLLAKARGEK